MHMNQWGTAKRKGRKQICSNLKLPRHISTLHRTDMPTTLREVRFLGNSGSPILGLRDRF
jgi:hypothetical protein